MRARLLLAFLLASPVFSASLFASQADLRSVSGMQSHNRVLLVFSPSLRDPRLDAQRKIMARFSIGAAERDLVFVQVAEGKVIGAHDKADSLRRKFDAAGIRFRVLLIGKDGKVALDKDTPADARDLITAIDAMPMRQAEMQKAHEGHPLPKTN